MLLQWKFGTLGLNAWGFPGTGKTRTMSILVNRLHGKGLKIFALAPGDFEAGCQRHNYRRSDWLNKLAKAEVLFLDDFDKMNLTREMEKSLFQVLNWRMGRKPVLLTHNSTARELEYNFKLGRSLVRRIRDTCLSVHFGEHDITNR
jgi:DNA replication protein DnaC